MTLFSRISKIDVAFILLIVFSTGWHMFMPLDRIYGADNIASHLPYFTAWFLKGDVLPLWQDQSHAGLPALVNCSYGYFYPPNSLIWFWGPLSQLRFYWFFHSLLLTSGLYIWVGSFCSSKKICFVSTLIFMSSMTVISLQNLGHLLMTMGYAWSLWIILLNHDFLNHFKNQKINLTIAAKFICFESCFIGLIFLGGNPQVAHHTVVVLVIYSFFYWIFEYRYALRLYIPIIFSIFILSAVLAFVQIYPILEYLSSNNRNVAGLALEDYGILTPSLFAKWFFPFIWGGNSNYWGQGSFDLAQNSIGIIGWLSLIVYMTTKSKNYVLVLSGVVIIVLCLGRQTPLYHIYSSIVPMANSFRFPLRFAPYAFFFLIPLVGLGLEQVKNQKSIKPWQIISFLIFILSYICFTCFDLKHLWDFILPLHVLERYQKTDLLKSLPHVLIQIAICLCVIGFIRKKLQSLSFVSIIALSIFYNIQFQHNTLPVKKTQARQHPPVFDRVLIKNQNSYHNVHLHHHLNALVGYDSFMLTSYRKLLDTIQPQNWKVNTREQCHLPFHQNLEFFNIKYLIPNLDAINQHDTTWEEVRAQPRYYISRDFSWDGLQESQFTKEIQFHQQNLKSRWEKKGFDFSKRTSSNSTDSVKIISYTPERVELEVHLEGDGVLASSDNFDQHWVLKVNGKEQNIQAWLGSFRSTPLKAGDYKVVYEYQPPIHLWMFISGFTAILLILCCLFAYFIEHRKTRMLV